MRVLVLAMWMVVNCSGESMAEAESKVCIVRTETRQKVDKSSSLATAKIAYGGKAAYDACMNSCTINPACLQAVWHAKDSKCYRNKKITAESTESQTGFTSMRCEFASHNKQNKVCKILKRPKHVEVSEDKQISVGDIKYGGTVETEAECLSPCALSASCMEATWSVKDKKCYASKAVLEHKDTAGSGDFWTLSCAALSAEQIKQAGQAQGGNKTIADIDKKNNETKAEVPEIESKAEARAKEKAAAEKAKAAEEAAAIKVEEVKQEVAAKTKAKKIEKERATKAKAAAEAAALAKGKEQKKKAAAAVKIAKEKDHKAREEQLALIAEGKDKKEKKVKAEEKVEKADSKKELSQKALNVSKMASEKRNKRDKWFGKGHLLFAQGIKYQGLLEAYSKAHHKLSAFNFRNELETYSDAFPKGFTAPLSKDDGKLGKTLPAGSQPNVVRLLD